MSDGGERGGAQALRGACRARLELYPAQPHVGIRLLTSLVRWAGGVGSRIYPPGFTLRMMTSSQEKHTRVPWT